MSNLTVHSDLISFLFTIITCLLKTCFLLWENVPSFSRMNCVRYAKILLHWQCYNLQGNQMSSLCLPSSRSLASPLILSWNPRICCYSWFRWSILFFLFVWFQIRRHVWIGTSFFYLIGWYHLGMQLKCCSLSEDKFGVNDILGLWQFHIV